MRFLHRRVRGWDVLVYELSVALADAYWAIRRGLRRGPLRVGSDDLPAVSTMLARGFEVHFGRILRGDRTVAAAVDAGMIGRPLAADVAARVARDVFDPLLRKFVEDVEGEILPRPDADLSRLVAVLEATVAEALATRCAPGGDLHPALAAPLSDRPAGFPDNKLPVDPSRSAGSVSRDIIALAPTIHADDDVTDVKRKLIHFARNDPWMAQECFGFILDRVEAAPPDFDEVFASNHALDDFLYSSTTLAGRTPIELFIERQPEIAERQRLRLERWNRDNFTGVFHIGKIERPFVVAEDLGSGVTYRLLATREQALDSMRRGDLLTSRAVPWDDHWVMSGVQHALGNVNGKRLEDARRLLRCALPSWIADPNDPKVKQAFEIQAAQCRAWVGLFGSDELVFDDGRALQATLNRFYRHWGTEMLDPATGLTRAALFERRYNRPAPDAPAVLDEEILGARDVGILVDPFHGTHILIGFGLFRSAFESVGQPTDEQVAMVMDYLRDPSVDYAVFLRTRARQPSRLEELLRVGLRDEQFRLETDFDPLLRKYKGEAMRKPRRPDVIVVEPGVDL